jgi:hypothetical protein
MATSGSFNTNSIGAFYFTVAWNRTGYSSTENKHYIHYSVTAHNTAGYYRTVYAKKLTINGSTVYEQAGTSGNGRSFYDGTVLTSGDITINSSNDAGDGTLSISFEAGVGQYPSTNCSGSNSWSLDRIPRYLSINTFEIQSRTVNSVVVKWATSNPRDNTQYILNNGSETGSATYGESVASDSKSGTFNIKDLSPNTTYKLKIKIRRTDSQLWTTSNEITFTTYDIAKLTEAPDVNIGSAHTIKWTNPSGASISLKLCKTDGTTLVYNVGTVTGTSKSVTPTAADIYALIPNDNSIKLRYVITTTANSTSYTNIKDCTFKVTNSNPTFSNFTYQDTDSTTVALTGNNQIIVNNYSNIQATISTANKAVAKNSATMKSYKLACGTKNVSKDYSSSADVNLSINDVDSATITVYATDSRGNSTSIAKTATFKNYSDLAITKLTATRQQNGVGSAVLLEFEGTYWNNSFGSVTNAIQQCIYKYKLASSSTWITGETQLSYSASNGTFSGSMLIKGDLGTDGFNVANAYNIRLQMADKLVTKAVDITLPSGAPGLAIAKQGLAIKQKYDTSLGGALQVNGIIYALDSTTGNFIDIVQKIKDLESS